MPQHRAAGPNSSSASARSRRCPARRHPLPSYHTVRPFFSLDTSPARAIVARCLATIEKSIEQHSATSVTEHGRPHLSKHENSVALVGSARALSSCVSSALSNLARRRMACFGDGRIDSCTDATTQVYPRRAMSASPSHASTRSAEDQCGQTRDHRGTEAACPGSGTRLDHTGTRTKPDQTG